MQLGFHEGPLTISARAVSDSYLAWDHITLAGRSCLALVREDALRLAVT